MKKIICLLLCALSIIFCSACSLSGNAKRISVEETEEHFNKYVEDIKTCISNLGVTEIEKINANYKFAEFSDGRGNISLNINDDVTLDIDLYNDRSNQFGEDYELGIEKYRICYNHTFSNQAEFLNADKVSLELIAVAFSDAIGETVTENEIQEFLLDCKKQISIPYYDLDVSKKEIVKFSSEYKNENFDYHLNYTAAGNNRYFEAIVFGGNESCTNLD